MIKCKGCDGEIDHWPLARVKEERSEVFHYAGPALTHTPGWCVWFGNTRAAEIVAYIEGERKQLVVLDARVTPLPELATK